jgi:hypothetical protein
MRKDQFHCCKPTLLEEIYHKTQPTHASLSTSQVIHGAEAMNWLLSSRTLLPILSNACISNAAFGGELQLQLSQPAAWKMPLTISSCGIRVTLTPGAETSLHTRIASCTSFRVDTPTTVGTSLNGEFSPLTFGLRNEYPRARLEIPPGQSDVAVWANLAAWRRSGGAGCQ